MTGSFDQLLSRYGQSVTLTPRGSGDPISLQAFLQPVLRQQEALPFSPSPLGAVSTKQWLYLGSGRLPLSAAAAPSSAAAVPPVEAVSVEAFPPPQPARREAPMTAAITAGSSLFLSNVFFFTFSSSFF